MKNKLTYDERHEILHLGIDLVEWVELGLYSFAWYDSKITMKVKIEYKKKYYCLIECSSNYPKLLGIFRNENEAKITMVKLILHGAIQGE